MAELEFKANISNIARFERETGKGINSIVDSFQFDDNGIAHGFSAETILKLAIAMTKTDEDAIDEYVEEFGPSKLIESVFTSLEKNGFLATMAKETQEAASKPKPTEPSLDTGKA